MSNPANLAELRKTIFKKITRYSKKAALLGQRVRHSVFGFGHRSTAHIDRRSFPAKLLHDHRLLQRRRAFQQGGGQHSTSAQHALKKAQARKQP